MTKGKGWAAPGIDGIQNYWWKNLEPAQKALTRAFTKIKEDNTTHQFGGQLEELCYYQKPKTWRIR